MEGLAGDRDRQAEVDQPRHAVVAQDDVLRLDVAVQQAAGVDLGQPLGDLLDQPRARAGYRPARSSVSSVSGRPGTYSTTRSISSPRALHPVARRDERAAHPRQRRPSLSTASRRPEEATP